MDPNTQIIVDLIDNQTTAMFYQWLTGLIAIVGIGTLVIILMDRTKD